MNSNSVKGLSLGRVEEIFHSHRVNSLSRQIPKACPDLHKFCRYFVESRRIRGDLVFENKDLL